MSFRKAVSWKVTGSVQFSCNDALQTSSGLGFNIVSTCFILHAYLDDGHEAFVSESVISQVQLPHEW